MRQPLIPDMPDAGRGRAAVGLRIPALPEWVGVARLATAGIASRSGFSIEDIEDLKLAVAEACNCCIQNPGSGDVEIECVVDDRAIAITVQRAGANGGGPQSVTNDISPDAGGLGEFLIRALMDDVTYAFDRAAGTKLVMTRSLRT